MHSLGPGNRPGALLSALHGSFFPSATTFLHVTSIVRIRPKDHQRLVRLQARLGVSFGKPVSRQRVFSFLLDLGEARLARVPDGHERPMNDREIAALMKLPKTTGTRTREQDIDRDLYAAD
jgi:hypothetical protein